MEAVITLPVDAGVLLDRVDGLRVPLKEKSATVKMKAWEFRAFEVKP